jgi:hypothetical protein
MICRAMSPHFTVLGHRNLPISPIPEKFDLSITTGVGLPTGARSIAGPGAQPYLQFPCSVELGHGWALTGMVTYFFIPADPVNRYTINLRW